MVHSLWQHMVCWCIMNAKRLSGSSRCNGGHFHRAYDGRIEPFIRRFYAIRPHKGRLRQPAVSINYAGSEIISVKEHTFRILGFRCVPQVHGAAKDTLDYVKGCSRRRSTRQQTIPWLCPTNLIISAGNFHGEPLAVALDFLAIGMAELGSIASQQYTGWLPASGTSGFRWPGTPGLNSGFMIPSVYTHTHGSLHLWVRANNSARLR